jgi:hypothetical protein
LEHPPEEQVTPLGGPLEKIATTLGKREEGRGRWVSGRWVEKGSLGDMKCF